MFKDLKNILGISSTITIARVTGLLLGLAWMVLVTRNINVSQVGQIILGVSLSNVLAMFISLNIGGVAIKFIPSYIKNKKANHINGYLRTGDYFVLIFAAILAIFVSCIYFWQLHTSLEIIPSYILFSLLSAPLLGWMQLQASYVVAFEKVLLSVMPSFLFQPVLLLVLIWGGTTFELITTAEQFMLLYFIALVITALIQNIAFKNTLNPNKIIKANYSELKKWLIQALLLIIPLLFIQNSAQLIVVLSADALSEKEIAVLGIVLRIMSLLLFSIGAITMASAPRLSKELHSENSVLVTRTLAISGLAKIIIAAIAWLTILGLGKYILSIFGEQYIVGQQALLILAFVPIITATFGPVVLFVTLLNLHVFSLIIFLITIFLLAILTITVGATYGVNGIAYAVLTTWLFWNACLHAVIKIKGKYDVSIFCLFKLNKEISSINTLN